MRQHSIEKYRDRKHADSWDDEDDYEYEEERIPRFHRSERQKWEMERERYNLSNRDHNLDKWDDEWNDDRRHRRRREGDRERWCCPDWDMAEHEKSGGRYPGGGRWPHSDAPPAMWRERKHDERYYSRESQDSPWEDDYSNEAEEMSPHYLTAKRNWKRPSSASEMDRKTGEIRTRHYLTTGGSDGERDRRYKPGRRSRSRDSQYSDTVYRHKPEIGSAPRGPHRNKQYSKQQFENDFTEIASKKIVEIKMDHSNKKCATLTGRKKVKESPKSEINIIGTFPRKSSSRSKSLFENDFIPDDESPANLNRAEARFNFENEFENSETESPTLTIKKGLRQSNLFEKNRLDSEFNKDNYRQSSLKELKLSPRLQTKSKSLFEDDFSPSGKTEPLPKDNSISSIKEEIDPKQKEDTFSTNNFENATNSRKKKLKNRLSNNIQTDINIKKSESVNIFARENDPFDDDFFSENISSHEDAQRIDEITVKQTDLKWTEEFEEFPLEENK